MAPSIFEQRVVIPPSVIFRELDGESVLLSFDSERYYGLDVVGTRIWQTLAEAETVRAAFDRLLQEFDVEPDLLQRDIEALMRELSAQGLVVLEAASPAG
ncbi:MAG: PqqD family protein [Ardenticatenia bacterium]|nr:PqqD family protein [Ardenticatenia bacterium]